MNKFWNKKWFWILFFFTALLTLGVFLFWQSQDGSEGLKGSNGASSEFTTGDFNPPTVLIESPKERTWQGVHFAVSIFQEDLETGIDQSSCFYQVCSYNSEKEEQCTGEIQRVCNTAASVITLGNEGMCPFEGRDACTVFVGAEDLAGNRGETSATFHIDLVPPSVEKLSIKEQDRQYLFSTDAKDNVGLRLCGLYLNERFVQFMDFAKDCQKECKAGTLFGPKAQESVTFFARCSDYAGNSADGESVLFAVNQPPHISSCRVVPTRGNIETEFRFFVETSDPDKDTLSFAWDFGNGKSSFEQFPSHSYETSGTYTPRVFVSEDNEEVLCSTAWVVVE